LGLRERERERTRRIEIPQFVFFDKCFEHDVYQALKRKDTHTKFRSENLKNRSLGRHVLDGRIKELRGLSPRANYIH
jgi:hypothetical protein